MKAILFVGVVLVSLTLSACANSSEIVDELINVYSKSGNTEKKASREQMVAAVREALNQGNDRAIGFLGRQDGFHKNSEVRIPMPPRLARVEQGLRQLGQNKIADDFILSLNRAAESAVPLAKTVLADAIRNMTVTDVVNIVRGEEDAATRYFRRVSEDTLRRGMLPVVARATDNVGVTRTYKQLITQAGALAAFVDLKSLDLDAYVTQKSLDGLFLFIAREEKRIRENPVARTTELLRLVFGGN